MFLWSILSFCIIGYLGASSQGRPTRSEGYPDAHQQVEGHHHIFWGAYWSMLFCVLILWYVSDLFMFSWAPFSLFMVCFVLICSNYKSVEFIFPISANTMFCSLCYRRIMKWTNHKQTSWCWCRICSKTPMKGSASSRYPQLLSVYLNII